MEQALATIAAIVGFVAACCTIFDTIADCARRHIRCRKRIVRAKEEPGTDDTQL